MLIMMYYFAGQRIFSFTYLKFVTVFFRMVDLKMFEMQIIRSHPGPTELWTQHPTAISPGDSDTQENRRNTTFE